jgi:hypothetical protein
VKTNIYLREATRGNVIIMFLNNIGTIRWRMVLAFIAGMFITAFLAQTTPAAEIFLPHTSHKTAIPVPLESINSLKHDILTARMNQ